MTDPLPEDAAGRVKLMLESASEALGAGGPVEVTREGDQLLATVESEDASRLIGRHGRTLDALGVLCGQAARIAEPDVSRVEVDAAGYRAERRRIVESIADRAADRALAESREVDLEPMSAADRRTVHEHLRERSGVDTFSSGSGADRHTVVSPVTSA